MVQYKASGILFVRKTMAYLFASLRSVFQIMANISFLAILGTNGLNSADVPLSNKQTNVLILTYIVLIDLPGYWTHETRFKRYAKNVL